MLLVRLLNEPVSLLQDIVEDFAIGEEKNFLSRLVEFARNFLKTKYSGHLICTDDDASTHGLVYSLQPVKEDVEERNGTCDVCLFPNFVCLKIRECVHKAAYSGKPSYPEEKVSDALRAVNDCEHKFELFRAYKCREHNQEVALQAEIDLLKEECLREERTRKGSGYNGLENEIGRKTFKRN